MTDKKLAEIEQRLQAATPGPWERHETMRKHRAGFNIQIKSATNGHYIHEDHSPNYIKPENAELIAHAPTDIAALLAEVRRLSKINEQHLRDLVDDDDRVRASCARMLSQAMIDGDSYAVPGVADLCEMVVVKCEALRDENSRLQAEMKEVWLITTGSYSSYSVQAVASTEEKANTLSELLRSDYGEVNEPLAFDVDEYADQAERGLKRFVCWWRDMGDITIQTSFALGGMVGNILALDRSPLDTVNPNASVMVLAKDENDAIKQAADLRAKHLVDRGWIVPPEVNP